MVHELPGVGANLQDHVLTVVQVRAKPGKARAYNLLASLGWLARFALTGGGPLTLPPVQTGAFLRTRPELGRPDLQFHVLPWGGFTPNFDEKRNPDTGAFLTVLPTLIYPKSRSNPLQTYLHPGLGCGHTWRQREPQGYGGEDIQGLGQSGHLSG